MSKTERMPNLVRGQLADPRQSERDGRDIGIQGGQEALRGKSKIASANIRRRRKGEGAGHGGSRRFVPQAVKQSAVLAHSLGPQEHVPLQDLSRSRIDNRLPV